MTVEMDMSDCTIVGILSVTTEDGEIQPVAFYSHTLQSAKWNYDMHDKELLVIYEAFKSWHHYLEGLAKTINTVTDHKNLEYFTTTKKLTRWQARWSEFLSQINLSICFQPCRVGAKPDTVTWRPDIYSESAVTDCNRQPVRTRQQLERPHLAICLGTVEEAEQSLSEDLDHRALVMDITRVAESDHLAQELWSKLETSDPPWGWEWSEGQLQFQGCLYVPNQEILHLQVIRNHHDHPVAGHFREARTSELIHHSFHWPGLRQMVKDYVASCTMCARTKSVRHKPYGKLKQLPIPSQPWSSISMEFISHVFLSLGKLLRMRLHFTSGHHPEGDGQTEHANQVLEQYLRVYTNYQQDDWATLLPMAKFAYNNATNATTGVSPFFTNKGYHPEFTADLQVETSSAEAQAFVAELKENIAQAQERYQKNADKHRTEAPKLKIGDQAYVKAKFFRTR